MNEQLPDAARDTAGDADHPGHEPDAVHARLVMMSIGGLVLLVTAGLLVVHFVSRGLSTSVTSSAQAPADAIREEEEAVPAVSADQPQELRDLRDREQRLLSSYEWIDKEAGLARIPIEQAMRILAERGLDSTLPAGGTSAAREATPESTEATDATSEGGRPPIRPRTEQSATDN